MHECHSAGYSTEVYRQQVCGKWFEWKNATTSLSLGVLLSLPITQGMMWQLIWAFGSFYGVAKGKRKKPFGFAMLEAFGARCAMHTRCCCLVLHKGAHLHWDSPHCAKHHLWVKLTAWK